MSEEPEFRIRVGITEAHGKAQEEAAYPPRGVEYFYLEPVPASFRWIRSPIKGFMRGFDYQDADLIEAVLSPVATERPWIYSLAQIQEAAAFSVLGCPLPRSWRMAYVNSLLSRDNCRKLVFWSQTGLETLLSYGRVKDHRILDKSTVVYPSIRQVSEAVFQHRDRPLRLLFSGDFFRKGGVHVVDAFERLQKKHTDLELLVCSDEDIDFKTPDRSLRSEFLEKLRANPAIRFGRVCREELVRDILPNVDIFLLPTYDEAFGYAILEAMAYGIPVIATTSFAIPEIVEDQTTGFLINFGRFDPMRFCKGYVVQEVPEDFRKFMTDEVYSRLSTLLESSALCRQMGTAAVQAAAQAVFTRDAQDEDAGDLSRGGWLIRDPSQPEAILRQVEAVPPSSSSASLQEQPGLSASRTPDTRPVRVCIVGLGGGGFQREAELIMRDLRRPAELVLVFAGPAGGILRWHSPQAVVSAYKVRSPLLIGDSVWRLPFGVLSNLWSAIRILLAERVDLVVGVGTVQMLPFSLAARLLGRQAWFAESLTRVDRPSRAGKWLSRLRLAHRTYFFWPSLKPALPRGICLEDGP